MIPLRASLAHHPLPLVLNVNLLFKARANSLEDLNSEPTEAAAPRMEATLVGQTVEANSNQTETINRTTSVTKDKRTAPSEDVLEDTLSKIARPVRNRNNVVSRSPF